jgi:hypothetical protein
MGWGLYFIEKVWKKPLYIVNAASQAYALLLTIIWIVKEEPKLGTVVSGPFVLGFGQAVVALMEDWAESKLARQGSER